MRTEGELYCETDENQRRARIVIDAGKMRMHDVTESVIVTASPEETEIVGTRLGEELAGATTIALHGDLGAGKTVLAKGIARGLGVDEPVTSPTFTLVQYYHGRRLSLIHIDLYRIVGPEDALAFGIDECLGKQDTVTVVEWAGRIQELLVPPIVVVRMTSMAGDRRRIAIIRDWRPGRRLVDARGGGSVGIVE